jgi:hypothetical protein
LEAIVDFALDHPDYGPAFRALIAQRVRSGVKKTWEQRV